MPEADRRMLAAIREGKPVNVDHAPTARRLVRLAARGLVAEGRPTLGGPPRLFLPGAGLDALRAAEAREAATRIARVTEATVEKWCDDLAAKLGADVVEFSQAQAAQQTPGIPDRRYRARGRCVWFEVKPADGKLSAEQLQFLTREMECGQIVGCGGVDELAALLTAGEDETARQRGWRQVQAVAARGLRRPRTDARRRPVFGKRAGRVRA
jgi:hypothetical protein